LRIEKNHIRTPTRRYAKPKEEIRVALVKSLAQFDDCVERQTLLPLGAQLPIICRACPRYSRRVPSREPERRSRSWARTESSSTSSVVTHFSEWPSIRHFHELLLRASFPMKFAHGWNLNLPRKRVSTSSSSIHAQWLIMKSEQTAVHAVARGKMETSQLQLPLLQRLDHGAKTVSGNPFGHPMVGAKLAGSVRLATLSRPHGVIAWGEKSVRSNKWKIWTILYWRIL
jgi:hypothetical protein